MALIERFLATDDTKIPAHGFYAANVERIGGSLTRQNVIDIFAMSAEDITEYDLLAAQAPSGTTTTARIGQFFFLNKIHAVLILNELNVAGYTTAALVRAKLGL